MNTYLTEIINILQDVIKISNAHYELHNIKLSVPDTVVNKEGKLIKRSNNKIQTSYHDFITTKMKDILIYLALILAEATEDCKKVNSSSTRAYRKYDLILSEFLKIMDKF